jgi:hypothetical protein
MANSVNVKIDGDDVRPETVSIADLADVLRCLYQAFSAFAVAKGVSKDSISIGLTKVEGGSDSLCLEMDSETSRYSTSLIEDVANRNDSHLPLATRNGLLELQSKARTRSWDGIWLSSANTTAVAGLLPEIDLFTESPLVTGGTSLLARIIRVGGESPSAKVKLSTGENFTAEVCGRGLAESLAEYLYQWVEVSGEATWNSHTLAITHLRITGIGPFSDKTSDPKAALTELREVSGGFWDSINPTDFLKDMRGN